MEQDEVCILLVEYLAAGCEDAIIWDPDRDPHEQNGQTPLT
jgi:hypothetical protein